MASNCDAGATPLDRLACAYVRLVLALGERDPDSLDFAVVPDSVRAEVHASYPTLDVIGNQAEGIRAQLQELRRADRRTTDSVSYRRARSLDAQLAAVVSRTAILRGRAFPFVEEAHLLFATGMLTDRYAQDRRVDQARILDLLPLTSEARKVSAAERYAAYDRRFLVPPDRLMVVMTAALAACRKKTLEHLALPEGEAVRLVFVHNQPWSAFSRYLGNGQSTIQLNLDLPITVDEALELACHEGYPGHHVFNTLRDAALLKGNRWPEAAVQPTFSPQSYVSEAAAAYAPRLAFSLPERSELERTVLFPLAGLRVPEAARYVTISDLVRKMSSAEPRLAREYLDGRLEFVRAEEALAKEALMLHAEATLLYLNEYRSYMLAYTDGPRRVAYLVRGREMSQDGREMSQGRSATDEKGAGEQLQWTRYRELMTNPTVELPSEEATMTVLP